MPITIVLAVAMIGLSIPIFTFTMIRSSGVEGGRWFRRDTGRGEGTTDLRELALAESARSRIMGSVASGLASGLGRFTPASWRQSLERRIVLAGAQGRLAPDRVLLIKGGLAILLLGLGYLFWAQRGEPVILLLAVVFGLTGYVTPDILLDGRAQRRQAQIQKDLPDVLDQITMSVEAGLGFEAAVSRVVRADEGPLIEEFSRALKEMQIGIPRSEALRGVIDRTDVADLKTFLISIIQSEEYGLPIAQVLRVQAAEIRVKRRQRAEERALRMPVKLIFPLGLCIFPTMFIVLLGPAVIRIWRALA